jgi:NAD(P)-dependent dehydrogenase (short-subunit alcohol dehydrogenase family)
MAKLSNQVAVVTGACKGIGAGIAKALAAGSSITPPGRRELTAS